MKQISVVIVDDHPCFTTGIRLFFEHSARDIHVVGVAHSATEGIETVFKTLPDVVLMDLRLPDRSGLDAAQELKRRLPRTKVVIVTGDDDPRTVGAALEIGIHGYVVKDAQPERLLEAIRVASEGGLSFDARARAAVVEWSVAPLSLEAAETEILRLVSRGHDNETIAGRTAMSVATVKRRLQGAIAKLQAANRTEAAVMAVRRGLI